MSSDFIALTLVPLVIAVLTALACAVLGTFLVLRRQSLLVDAISHVVLPGIVLAFLVMGHIAALPMIIGALVAALCAVALINGVHALTLLDNNAIMGTVFTAFFAFGVLLLEQSQASGVHLDVEHALYGNLENLIWLDAVGGVDALFASGAGWWDIVRTLPPALWRVSIVLIVVIIAVWGAWYWLVLSTFDADFAAAKGVPVRFVNIGLMGLTALVTVVAFSVTGAIIVIALFVCPAAAAHVLTTTMRGHMVLACVFAVLAALVGFWAAFAVPPLFGHAHAISAAGAIATVAGFILAAAVLFTIARKHIKHALQRTLAGTA